MKTYQGGNSGISAYDPRPHSIVIEFKSGEQYRYDYSRPGRRHVEEMKRRAAKNAGLTTYINQNVRKNYARKLK
jgi:hypothetical protein